MIMGIVFFIVALLGLSIYGLATAHKNSSYGDYDFQDLCDGDG